MSHSFAYLASEHHPLVEVVVRRARGGDDGELDLTIDSRDEMFADALAKSRGDRDGALANYFAAGLEVADSILQILDDLFPSRSQSELGVSHGTANSDLRVLDFGCGYGRATRFLAARLRASNDRERRSTELWASDILLGALDFQRSHFAVETFASAREPRQLAAPCRFDLIYVGSLFTHLPEATFYPWLERLSSLLTGRGVLAFTVHEQSLLPPHHRMPASGLCFEAASESRTLDPQDYGSAWVTAEFVKRQLFRLRTARPGRSGADQSRAGTASMLPGAASQRPREFRQRPTHRQIARGLCNYQDLYLSSATGGPDLERLRYDGGAEVRIERCEPTGSGELVLSGWAVSRFAGFAVDEIRIELDEKTIGATRPQLARPDCFARLSEIGLSESRIARDGLDPDQLLHSGWRCHCRLPAPHSGRARLVVSARTERMTRTIFAGSLDRAIFLAAEQNFRQQYDRCYQLEEKVARMKQSRFWQLRSHWFTLKRALGVSDER